MTIGYTKDTSLYWAGRDVSRMFRQATVDRSRDTLDATVFKSTSKEFLAGLRDGTLSAEGIYSRSTLPAVDGSSDALQAAFDMDAPVIVFLPDGDAVGVAGSGLAGPETSYVTTAATEDLVMVSAEALGKDGVERLVSLRPLGAQAAGTENGTEVDGGAQSPGGAVGYLVATDVTGTLEVTVQHSDVGGGGAWVDLITFTEADADYATERLAAAGPVERFVRVIATVTGGPCTWHAAFGRKPA